VASWAARWAASWAARSSAVLAALAASLAARFASAAAALSAAVASAPLASRLAGAASSSKWRAISTRDRKRFPCAGGGRVGRLRAQTLACRAVNMNRLCAREGCAHDGAALPLTCVLKKYES